MKKTFAIVLTLAIILSGFSIQSEAVDFEEWGEWTRCIISAEAGYPDSKTSMISVRETEKAEDGKLTIDIINQMSSWDELVKTAIPLNLDYENIENFEDKYCIMLIDGINNKHLSTPLYHDELYVGYVLGGIDLEKINFERMMSKFRAIINLYNKFSDFQLMWEYKVRDSGFMQIDVHSINYIWMCNPAKEIGQKVIVRTNTKYFESAWGDGSGRFEVVKFPNHFDIESDIIPENLIFTVNGVAYLDENWERVLESYYIPYNELGEYEPKIRGLEYHMLHICTENGDYGWVHAEDVMRIEDAHMF